MSQAAQQTKRADALKKGDVLLAVDNVSLAFGGVRAISDVSFDINKGEIRAIIGPNGAGKTSMLNVINGFYHPNEGRIMFAGETRPRMKPYEAASQGIARTFQNVAGGEVVGAVVRHAAFSAPSGATKVMSVILTLAEMTPLRPSSNVTSVRMSAFFEPS